MKLLYPNVNKYCTLCYKLNNDDIYVKLPDGYHAWWTRCNGCGVIR